MRQRVIYIGGVLVLMISVVGYIFWQKSESTEKLDNSQEVEDSGRETSGEEGSSSENGAGRYIEYKKASLTDETNVVFFAASWCPTCRGLDRAINSNLDSIPSDLVILKADYDLEIDLRRKYEITYQHTLVQVDKNGNMIKKWNGSKDISEIVKELM